MRKESLTKHIKRNSAFGEISSKEVNKNTTKTVTCIERYLYAFATLLKQNVAQLA
jgi:hypothetical protein